MKGKISKVNESNITKKIVAILLIISLTMIDFVMLGNEMVSYAVDAMSVGTATNNRNVTFDSYFKDNNGNIVSSKEESIDNNNISLFIQVSVKNDGYFNGEINLENSNFKIKNEILSDSINKIDGNTVTLNQINSGETIEIELKIEPLKDDSISSGLLNMLSNVTIKGIYKNSSERNIDIKATRQVQLIFNNPYAENEGIELKNSIITNKVYKINGENKRIVQVLVESGLNGNRYPVKENKIEVSVPNGVENVEVISRGMLSTNGKNEAEFGKSNWNYLEKDKKVNIIIKNEADNGKIKWMKNGKDELIVTYVMPVENNITNADITAKSVMTLYDTKSTVKEATKTIKIIEEMDNIIGTGIELEENEIYKGKIYSGENREYKETTNIYVNSNKTGKSAVIDLHASTYEISEGELEANIELTKTMINKSEITRILGEEGNIVITSGEKIVSTISKETETDENGNIVVNYPEGTKSIRVEVSQPIATGTIKLNNTKTIKQDGNAKEVKEKYLAIKEKATGTEAKIKLKETETRAELNINKEKLSTLAKNENVEIIVTLKTDSEKYDLFKNPTFEIIMPESIKSMDVKTLKPLYSDMFKVKEATITDGNNGSRIIKVVLEGQQTNYTTDINQATIVMVGDIEFEELTPSSQTAIKLNYTNENGIAENYNESKNVEIESKYGLMMNTVMEGYNNEGEKISTMDDKISKGNLEIESSSKITTVKETIINNYDNAMQNVNIVGRIPTEGINDGTVNTVFVGEVRTTIEGAKILYSKDKDAKAEDNTWNESIEGAKAFKIGIDNLEKGTKINTEYSFEIPENLEYGESLYTKVDTKYTYLGNSMEQTSTVGAETPKLTGFSSATLKNSVETSQGGLTAKIGTTTAGRELTDGDSVYEGQAIEYTTYITNNTGRDLNNVNISVEQENGTMYGLKEVEVFMDAIPIEGEKNKIEHTYSELNTNSKEFGKVENFPNGKTITFKYEIVTNEVDTDSKTNGTITVKANDFEEVKINTISNKIEQAELKVNCKYRFNEELELYYGQSIQTLVNIQNISDKDLKNIKATLKLPEGTFFDETLFDYDQNEEIANVKYNQTEKTITFEITKLNKNETKIIKLNINTNEFNMDEKEFVFIVEAATESNKTYFSNVMTKTMKNIVKDITLTQETNIDENKILNDEDEFILTISAKNNSNTDIKSILTDELPECFTILDANLEKLGQTEKLDIIRYNEDSELNIEKKNYIINNTVTVNEQLGANQEIKIILKIRLNTYSSDVDVTNTVNVEYGQLGKDGNYLYSNIRQNEKTFKIEPMKTSDTVKYVEVNQSSNIENKSTINDGQEVIYTTTIKNMNKNALNIAIRDALPSGMEVKEVTIDGKNTENAIQQKGLLNIKNYTLESEKVVDLKVTASYKQIAAVEEELTNVVTVFTPAETVSSNAITYYASYAQEKNEQNSNENEIKKQNGEINNIVNSNSDNKNEFNNREIEENTTVSYTISGLAWEDANKNGQRELEEKLLQGIEVKVLDTETGNFVQQDGKDVSAMTDENGNYSFKLLRGKYVVVFMYDNNKYGVTQYMKQGVSNSRNSDVINRTIQVNGTNYDIASTDTIKLISDNVENIDMGLLENTKFDLELKKYVDEITVKTSKGVNTYNYYNSELAKVEIHAKELNSANVIIKYTIRVTNNGEIAGYVKDIADYMPTSLTFNSELNTDWYQLDKNIHNTSLINTKLEAGETKDITLILTKNMTENNTGLISNIAELVDVSNELGVQDLDSTPGNKAQGEDDQGKADVIIGVKTGALVTYISLVIAILVIMGAGAFIMSKKLLKVNLKEMKF